MDGGGWYEDEFRGERLEPTVRRGATGGRAPRTTEAGGARALIANDERETEERRMSEKNTIEGAVERPRAWPGTSALLRGLTLLAALALVAPAVARELPADPLRSVMWESMASRFMPEGEVVFDERVKLLAPYSAENQFDVPVTVDATALEDVEEIIAFADLNPIPLVLRARPEGAAPFLGFRLKLQQTSPVHVAARTADGVWHVAGAIVDAAGGGCTAPAAAHGTANWMDTLGETRAQLLRTAPDEARMTLRMRHPMDTGLAAGIPVFYLETLDVRDEDGAPLMSLELFEPVSENPTLTLKPRVGDGDTRLEVSTRDTEGNVFAFALEVPAAGGS